MRRRRWAAALSWPPLLVLLAACGVEPSGVAGAGEAPTGVAPGVTLYFVDSSLRLQPQLRQTNHLGSISDAIPLLLFGANESGLHSEIQSTGSARAEVNTFPGLIQLRVPLSLREVSPLGIDQLVCTALGVFIQGGGDKTTKVQVEFTDATPESDKQRTCPLFR
ncbi:hypothetical protein [Amycolatopsis pigmentata]|uniref:GerMN domain-containing protein n=1 Tax=Amycolatopsis pigmentata TaxID=450801 RepID=A0ABW5G7X2_9PSEU